MKRPNGTRVIRTFAEFDQWLGHAVEGRSNRHQLWLGRPGKGKTARLHRHVQNTVGKDMFPAIKGRIQAPVYSGRITPAKWFIRGWQHHLEPLLCLNDVSIRRVDDAWESMLCQFLETPGARTIRWDLKSRSDLGPEDLREIASYLRRMGLLDRFVREQREQIDERQEDDELMPADGSDRSSFRGSLPELDDYERAYGEYTEKVVRATPVGGMARERLILPRSYDTESTVIMVANDLGTDDWERIFSRLKVFVWEPHPEEQIEDLRTWYPKVPGAILAAIETSHQKGEVLSLDYRAILEAIDALRLGMPWKDGLRASFFTPDDEQVQQDGNNVLDWLVDQRATAGKEFTESNLYQQISSLRGNRNKARRSAALDFLVAQGWIERFLPPSVIRPGARGRRPGMTFRVLRLPLD
jgi:hypothetical protein